jgi:hypothetical protein
LHTFLVLSHVYTMHVGLLEFTHGMHVATRFRVQPVRTYLANFFWLVPQRLHDTTCIKRLHVHSCKLTHVSQLACVHMP